MTPDDIDLIASFLSFPVPFAHRPAVRRLLFLCRFLLRLWRLWLWWGGSGL